MITIGMPVFNDLEFIEKSLLSIINQSWTHWRLIISDDGSSDGSQQICERYTAQDDRIEYIRQDINLGISRNMEFLLSKASTPYFMWAGDDDLYHPSFINKCISALEANENAVAAFPTFAKIDENGVITEDEINFNYAHNHRQKRLRNYIKNATDYFGYGVFRTQFIRGVRFPVWWWPNKKTPYNNIYPTLCFYLAKGDYIHIYSEPLFFKRIKSGANVHHILTGENNAIKESFAYWIRKFNLVCFSSKQIAKASNSFVVFSVLPYLFYYWFIVPSWQQFTLSIKSFLKNKITI